MAIQQMRQEVKRILSKRDNKYISELRMKVVDILENKIYSEIQPEAKNMSFVSGKKSLTFKESKDNPKTTAPSQSPELTWHRHILMDGLEVNVRSDVQNKFGSVLLEILQQFKNSFER